MRYHVCIPTCVCGSKDHSEKRKGKTRHTHAPLQCKWHNTHNSGTPSDITHNSGTPSDICIVKVTQLIKLCLLWCLVAVQLSCMDIEEIWETVGKCHHCNTVLQVEIPNTLHDDVWLAGTDRLTWKLGKVECMVCLCYLPVGPWT